MAEGKLIKPIDWSRFNFEKLEQDLLATVPEGRNPKEWFEEQYLTRPTTFEPDRS